MVANQRRRILDALALALVHHGYDDTRVTDVVELAGVSRATFYQHFRGKEHCFLVAYDDGVDRLEAAIGKALRPGPAWSLRLAAGLRAGLDVLGADPSLARLLLVEPPTGPRPVRLRHEHSLMRLGLALRHPHEASDAAGPASERAARLLAGGLAAHLSDRVFADGQLGCIAELHETLLGYVLASAEAA